MMKDVAAGFIRALASIQLPMYFGVYCTWYLRWYTYG